MTELDSKMIGRKSKGAKAKWWLLYPDDKTRVIWDLLITW